MSQCRLIIANIRIWLSYQIYVTVYGKIQHIGFSMKIEFDADLISSTIELTRVQVSDQSRASLWSYSALFVIAPHPQQLRNYGPRRCYARVWRFRILCIYWKSIKWTWVEPFEMNAKIERGSNFKG